jgi:hypothetical protein
MLGVFSFSFYFSVYFCGKKTEKSFTCRCVFRFQQKYNFGFCAILLLSSILFDLVLEAILQKINVTGHTGTKSIQIVAYADDVAIVGRYKNALKVTLVNIEIEARKRGLRINERRPSTWK